MGRQVTKIFGKSFFFFLSGELETKVELFGFKEVYYSLSQKSLSFPRWGGFNYYVFYQLLLGAILLIFFY